MSQTSNTPITSEEILQAHEGGKLSIDSKMKLGDQRSLSIAYTPGVAQVSRLIAEQPEQAKKYTTAARTVAVISDGSAVLGLGDIGASASLPVMEGKSALFKEFAGLDSIPIVLDTNDTETIIATVKAIAPTFGAVNLEDISAPRCFEIERRLIDELDMPVMHDDQHGTAVVTLAALMNALKVVEKDISDVKICMIGAGAAGVAIVKMLHAAGARNVLVVDSRGIIGPKRHDLTEIKKQILYLTNEQGMDGDMGMAVQDADVFIGVSATTVPEDMVKTMADDSVIFALSNPDPEIHPDVGLKYAKVMATGRSDFPNQINNVLAFPGIFKGVLDVGGKRITEEVKLAAAEAIANLVTEADLSPEYIVPSALDPRVCEAVAQAVAAVASEQLAAETEQAGDASSSGDAATPSQ